MDVATAPGLRHGRFRHERDRFPGLRDNLLHALLEENVVVRHGDRVAVGQVDFVLAAAPLALAVFHRNPGGEHLVPDRPEQILVARRLHGVVIDPVIARRGQVAMTLSVGIVEAGVEQEELQLAGHVAEHLFLGERGDLSLQGGPRRFLDGQSVVMKK